MPIVTIDLPACMCRLVCIRVCAPRYVHDTQGFCDAKRTRLQCGDWASTRSECPLYGVSFQIHGCTFATDILVARKATVARNARVSSNSTLTGDAKISAIKCLSSMLRTTVHMCLPRALRFAWHAVSERPVLPIGRLPRCLVPPCQVLIHRISPANGPLILCRRT